MDERIDLTENRLFEDKIIESSDILNIEYRKKTIKSVVKSIFQTIDTYLHIENRNGKLVLEPIDYYNNEINNICECCGKPMYNSNVIDICKECYIQSYCDNAYSRLFDNSGWNIINHDIFI